MRQFLTLHAIKNEKKKKNEIRKTAIGNECKRINRPKRDGEKIKDNLPEEAFFVDIWNCMQDILVDA